MRIKTMLGELSIPAGWVLCSQLIPVVTTAAQLKVKAQKLGMKVSRR